MKTKKAPASKKKKSLKEIQKFLEQFEQNEMLDDHGHMVVGTRDHDPAETDSEHD